MTTIKNIGILAHVDAGKTTVTEQLLYQSGALRTLGRVDQGNTVTDSMELERQRGITIRSATASFNWRGCKINLIDTPGHMDFLAEVERVFGVLDGAVLVISAKEGVQSQTRVIFRMLRQLGIPTILFLNKIDRLGVDLSGLYKQLQELLTPDTLLMQEVIYDQDRYKINVMDVQTEAVWGRLLDWDDTLAEKYLEAQPIQPQEFQRSLQNSVRAGKAYPVFHGAALRGDGVRQLMDAITELLPAQVADPEESLFGYVYKVDRDEKNTRRVFMRLLAGTLYARQEFLVTKPNGSQTQEKIYTIEGFHHGEVKRIDCVTNGDIAVFPGNRLLQIGDILGRGSRRVPKLSVAQPILQVSVSPAKPAERMQLLNVLEELMEEDPLLHMQISPEHEISIHLLGNTQLEVIQELLRQRYHLETKFGALLTILKERPLNTGEAMIPIYIPPNPYYAQIGLRIEPLPEDTGFQYESEVSYGDLSASFQTAVREGVTSACRTGLFGWELTDIKITFFDAVYDSVNATPADFRKLAPYVVYQALMTAGTQLLEPVGTFTLEIPGNACGRGVYDIQKMGGTVQTISSRGEQAVIKGQIPLAVSRGYTAELMSYTEGKGIFLREFTGYKPCIAEPETAPGGKPMEGDKLWYMFLKANQ